MIAARRFLALLLPLVLCGCMEYTEEVRIEKDGSGSMLIDSAVHKMLVDPEDMDHNREVNREYMEKLEARKDVDKAEYSDYFDENGLYHTVYEVWVDDYQNLPKLHMVGVGADEGIHFTKTQDGALSFTRVLDPDASADRQIPAGLQDLRVAGKTLAEWDADNDLDLDAFEAAAVLIAARDRAKARGQDVGDDDGDEEPGEEDDEGGFYQTYRLIAPKIVSSYGATNAADEDDTVVEWKYPIFAGPDEAPPASLHAQYTITSGMSSTWMWVGIGVVILLIILMMNSFSGWWKSGGLRKFAAKRNLI